MTEKKFLDFIGEEKLIWENDAYAFYTNDLTRDCTKKARAMDIHGIELRNWTVYKVVGKNPEVPEKCYVIYDEQGKPYHDTEDIWEMYDWIVMKKMVMTGDYDIVNMAERMKEEEEE